MSSDSSTLSKSRKKLTHIGNSTDSKLVSSEEKSEGQTSRGSRGTYISDQTFPQPKVKVLDELNCKKTSILNVYNKPNNEELPKGTATSHNSTTPTVITAVLRDLRDDIVRSPAYRQAGLVGPAALMNGERAIAVIGGENIYVQNKTKFISVPRDKALSGHHDQSFWSHHSSKLQEHSPLETALVVQKMFTPISTISFGLLGGVSLLQLLLVHHLVGGLSDQEQNFFLQSYSKFAQLTPLLFYILLTICIVSILDRIPVRREALVFERSWVVVVLYILTLILTLSCASHDDMISLYHQNKTLFNDQLKTQAVVADWKLLNTSRCILALLGWVLFSLTNPTDLLLQHLNHLKQYEAEKQYGSDSLHISQA